MPVSNVKKINSPKEQVETHTHQDNWEVMKPFVLFSVKAAALIGSTLFAIVKALPLLKPQDKTDTTVIKR